MIIGACLISFILGYVSVSQVGVVATAAAVEAVVAHHHHHIAVLVQGQVTVVEVARGQGNLIGFVQRENILHLR